MILKSKEQALTCQTDVPQCAAAPCHGSCF